MKPGKLPAEFLEYLIKKYAYISNSVKIGPAIGKDAAAIDMGSKYLVVKTDPVTLTSKQAGWYLVNINANDIACLGAKPSFLVATLLLPKNSFKKTTEEIFYSVSRACRSLGISLCGGHCEITPKVSQPVLIGAMFGFAEKERLVKSNAKNGDNIILTKGIAIETTSIIANEKEKILKNKFSAAFIKKAKNFLYKPGISVLKEALLANSTAKIRYMHDPTEGGIATGLYETAKANNCGLLVYEEKIKIYPESKILCDKFGLDIMGAIASGALIIVASPKETPKIVTALAENRINARVIGKIKDEKYGIKIERKNKKICPLKPFIKDEITKIYS